jgi:N-acetylglucosamine-6-sulfatase
MGDNGLLEGEHGMVDKRTMHEASIRIPLIVRYPKLTDGKSGTKITQQVLTTDIAPSILELCNAQPLKNIHGRSFKNLVRGNDPKWRNGWVYHYNYEKQFPYTPNVRGIRTNRWKYIHYPHGDGSPDRHLAELYDMTEDPDEKSNLVNSKTHQSVLRKLKNDLALELINVGLKKDVMPLDEGVQQKLPDKSIR